MACKIARAAVLAMSTVDNSTQIELRLSCVTLFKAANAGRVGIDTTTVAGSLACSLADLYEPLLAANSM